MRRSIWKYNSSAVLHTQVWRTVALTWFWLGFPYWAAERIIIVLHKIPRWIESYIFLQMERSTWFDNLHYQVRTQKCIATSTRSPAAPICWLVVRGFFGAHRASPLFLFTKANVFPYSFLQLQRRFRRGWRKRKKENTQKTI